MAHKKPALEHLAQQPLPAQSRQRYEPFRKYHPAIIHALQQQRRYERLRRYQSPEGYDGRRS